MDSNESKRVRGAKLEYILYGAIIGLTACGAWYYKPLTRNSELATLGAYLAAIYFTFLAWAFYELNRIHRKRKHGLLEQYVEAEPNDKAEEAVAVSRSAEDTWSLFGLSVVQLGILVAVFSIALLGFTWALSILRIGR